MKAAVYLGQEHVEVMEFPDPVCGENDVVIKNIYSSICGTDVAVYTHGPNTGHRVTISRKMYGMLWRSWQAESGIWR